MRCDVECMMMAAVDSTVLVSLVEDFVSGLQDSKARDTATGVKDGQFTILQVVEALGLSLTSSQVNTRARGVQMLSQVVQESVRQFSVKEVEVLIAFYENRLKDHHVITPHVLLGLKALSKHPELPPGSAVSILRSIFQDVHVQSLMLSERNCVYTILINLMESRETELKSLGSDFVFGFVQSMDGERDPRNLLLTFQIAKEIISRGYDMGKFVEELFEVTSCYFPIDFSPPPSDPHGITQEVLILSLRGVLSGTPLFAEFLLPLIIEKLDSDVQSAKVDSLQTLAACVETYQQQHLAEFLPGLWTSLRREVFQTTSEKVETAGLAALAAITSCLSRSVLSSDSEDGLSVFLELILTDCKHHLAEPDLKLVWPSAKLLQAASSTSYRASHIMTAAVIPSLIEQYNNRTQCSQRRTVLEVLHGFVQPPKNSQSAEEESVLLPFRESLCAVVFSAVLENSGGLQITATKVLTSLGQHTGLLKDDDVQQAVDHLTRLILEEKDDKVSVAVVECSGALSRRHPAAFISTMIPRLKEHISLEPMVQDDSNTLPMEELSHHVLRQRCLSALAAVSSHPSVVQESTPVLLGVLSSAHTGAVSFSVEEVVLACQSLQTIAQQAQDTEETARCYHDVIIPRLLSLALQAALQDEDSGSRSPLVEPAVLSAMVPVISTVCSRFQSKLPVQMVSRLVSLYLDGDVSCLPDNSFPSDIQLLKGGASSRLSQLVCLLMGCVCSLPRTMEVPQVDRLLSELEELSFTCLHPFSYTSAAKCYAGLLNKRPAGAALDSLVQTLMERMCSQLDSSALRMQAFTLLLWVAKALLLRYHPLSTAMTDKLFSLLGDSELGSLAAEGFSLLMSDSPDVLNRSCHADLRIMYRQRFFTENSATLVQSFNAAPPEKKSSYLKALGHIVNNLPRQVQLTELPALLHLILEALSCSDQEVQLSTLSCLQPVLLDPPQVLVQQLEALVSRLLKLTCSPAMNVRIASLRCIHTVANFPEHEVMPFRARVLKGLSSPLDDKKRLVRSEAVLARGEWFLLGSPGGR